MNVVLLHHSINKLVYEVAWSKKTQRSLKGGRKVHANKISQRVQSGKAKAMEIVVE